MRLFPDARLWSRNELHSLCERFDLSVRKGANRQQMCYLLDELLEGKQLKRTDWRDQELLKIGLSLNLAKSRRSSILLPAAAMCSAINDLRAGTTTATVQCLVC